MAIYNEVKFGKEAQDEIYKGAKIVADAVASSLGPNGKCAFIDGFNSTSYKITKDGVSIAKSIAQLKNKYQNLGANIIKSVSSEGGKQGDGSSTTVVLGFSMLEEGRKYLASGMKSFDLKKGIDIATKMAVEKIKAKAKPITSAKEVRNIATIASNNDSFIGNLVAKAHEQVGDNGIIVPEDSMKDETYLEFVEGIEFDGGYKSGYFVNNDKMTCEFKNAYILVTDEEINNLAVMQTILNQVSKEGRPILLISGGYGGQVIPALVVNKVNGALDVCAVNAPDFGETRKEMLLDICAMTGATFISESVGQSLAKSSINYLGVAEKVVVSKDSTLIVGGKGNAESIKERTDRIKSEIKVETVEAKKEKLQKRLAFLNGGVCVLRVYGSNEVELKELKDRIEDTICSVKASVKDGIVLGGGVTLLKVASELKAPKDLTSDQLAGFNIVKKALESPIRQLAKNSGGSEDVIVNKVLTDSDGQKSGFNFATMEWDENLFDTVVDPCLVETSALEKASSIIGLYLTTSVAITTVNDDENKCNCGR